MTEETRVAATLERLVVICENIDRTLTSHVHDDNQRFQDHEARLRETESGQNRIYAICIFLAFIIPVAISMVQMSFAK